MGSMQKYNLWETSAIIDAKSDLGRRPLPENTGVLGHSIRASGWSVGVGGRPFFPGPHGVCHLWETSCNFRWILQIFAMFRRLS